MSYRLTLPHPSGHSLPAVKAVREALDVTLKAARFDYYDKAVAGHEIIVPELSPKAARTLGMGGWTVEEVDALAGTNLQAVGAITLAYGGEIPLLGDPADFDHDDMRREFPGLIWDAIRENEPVLVQDRTGDPAWAVFNPRHVVGVGVPK